MTEKQSERLGWIIFCVCLVGTLLYVGHICGASFL